MLSGTEYKMWKKNYKKKVLYMIRKRKKGKTCSPK